MFGASGQKAEAGLERHAFCAGPVFLVLVTPTGLEPAGFVVVLALGLRVIAGAVSGVSKTRGLELPVAERVPSRAIVQCGFWSFCGSGDASVTDLSRTPGNYVRERGTTS